MFSTRVYFKTSPFTMLSSMCYCPKSIRSVNGTESRIATVMLLKHLPQSQRLIFKERALAQLIRIFPGWRGADDAVATPGQKSQDQLGLKQRETNARSIISIVGIQLHLLYPTRVSIPDFACSGTCYTVRTCRTALCAFTVKRALLHAPCCASLITCTACHTPKDRYYLIALTL